jgi:uncharacterized protein (TIGR03437 family)
LDVPRTGVTFSFVQGTTGGSQILSLSNKGGGTLNVNVAASTVTGGSWLSVSRGQAAILGGTTAPFTITADPNKVVSESGSGIGTFFGQILFTTEAAGQIATVPVTMAVTSLPRISLSRAGLSFSALQGGPAPPSEFVDIIDLGSRPVTWTAEVTTLTGGNWLRISATGGTASPGLPFPLSASVAPSVLAASAPGPYYGSIVIRAKDAETGREAANSPQTVAVTLNLVNSTGFLRPAVRPLGLIFTADPGASNVAEQTVSIFNLSNAPVAYSSVAVTDDGGNWCTASPATGTIAQTGTLGVGVNFTSLRTGSHACTLRILFADGSFQAVSISAVTTDTSISAAAEPRTSADPRLAAPQPRVDNNCNRLIVNLRQPGADFSVTAFQSTPLEVEVRNNCNQPVNLGNGATPSVFFNNSDDKQNPSYVGNGIYRGSWKPTNVSRTAARTSVTIQVVVQSIEYPNAADILVPGSVVLEIKNPTLISNIVNSASYTPDGQVSPCSWVAIFGENLGGAQVLASSVPLQGRLGDTSALMASRRLPLLFVNSGQINAQIPCDVEPNTTQNLQVVRPDTQSETEQVVVADAQPAIYTINQQGFGQGAILGIVPDGSQIVADVSRPVAAGDIVAIYCTGLGPVTPSVPEGTVGPTPASTLVRPVAVTIGGKPAEVKFGGLTPGVVGLYQLNVVVPDGVPPGAEIPVVITMAGQSSREGVFMAIR